MTNDLATVDESSLDVLPPVQAPSLAARQMLAVHAEMMQTAYELASRMVTTSMVPARFRNKPEDATAAILYGLEVGLNPIQSLQRIIGINGMPSLEARTMVALVKARGYKVRTLEQSDDSVTVWGQDLDGDEYTSTWTMARAVKAGYVPEINEKTGKFKTNANGKLVGNEMYLTDPQAMLKAKAQAEVCRDMAPDVLIGISYTTEELQSERFDNRPAPTSQQRSAPITVDEIMGETPADARARAADDWEPIDRERAEGTTDLPEPTGPHVAEDLPEDLPDEVTKAQLQKLSILRQAEGYADDDLGREDWFQWVQTTIGRYITTNKHLSKVEASVLIDVLETAQAQDKSTAAD